MLSEIYSFISDVLGVASVLVPTHRHYFRRMFRNAKETRASVLPSNSDAR